MYPNLKLQLWRSGIRQNRLAQLVGIHETLLSKIVNGFRQPEAHLRSRIAAVLQAEEGWLFTPLEPTHEEPSRQAAQQDLKRLPRNTA
jgi:transcriptional regulator with XRE-family HTH domain